jgi:hypothetical protein
MFDAMREEFGTVGINNAGLLQDAYAGTVAEGLST